jgi:hypothetical protein
MMASPQLDRTDIKITEKSCLVSLYHTIILPYL